MYTDKLSFKNGKFKIMQIADVQEIPSVSPDTLKLITLAVEREKPDLIVFTGDQLYGINPAFRIKDIRKNVTAVIKKITAPIEKAKIPFAVTFGNHDSQCGISNAIQAEIYAESPFYKGGKYRSDSDRGTYRVPIFGRNGEHTFDVYLIDSNGQAITGEYLPVSEEQLEWFRTEREKASEAGSYTPSLVFQHIPVPEYYDVLKKVRVGTKGAVEAFRTHKHEFYKLPEEIIKTGGFMHESPASPDRNSGEFDILKEKDNVLGLLVGHDHINSFVAEKDGIKLIYTQGTGFNVYGPKRERGVRIIELSEDDLTSFNTYTVTFGELTNDQVCAPVKEFILTHIPSSMEQVKRLAVTAAVTIGIGSTALAMIFKRKGIHKSER